MPDSSEVLGRVDVSGCFHIQQEGDLGFHRQMNIVVFAGGAAARHCHRDLDGSAHTAGAPHVVLDRTGAGGIMASPPAPAASGKLCIECTSFTLQTCNRGQCNNVLGVSEVGGSPDAGVIGHRAGRRCVLLAGRRGAGQGEGGESIRPAQHQDPRQAEQDCGQVRQNRQAGRVEWILVCGFTGAG